MKFLAFLVLAVLGTVAFAAFAQEREEEFIIFQYWTAGGEKEAIDALFELYQKRNPGVKIVENPVAGGGGEAMLAVLMSNLALEFPPTRSMTTRGTSKRITLTLAILNRLMTFEPQRTSKLVLTQCGSKL